MLKFGIKDYEEFKTIFGTTKNGGFLINKVLLNFWKFQYKKCGVPSRIRSLDELFDMVMQNLNPLEGHLSQKSKVYQDKNAAFYTSSFTFGGKTVHLTNRHYFVDTNDCIDFSNRSLIKCYTYNKKGISRSYSIGAGKFFRICANDCGLNIGESALTYCSEVFQRLWEASLESVFNLELVVDKDFKKIYTSSCHNGSFGSCMNDKGQYVFYERCVDANAAYLQDKEGMIYARCIIFNNVHIDGLEGSFRYAERQYASKECFKSILINKLILEGKIDYYKAIGAGCRDVCAIRDIENKPVDNKRLSMKCNINPDSTLSFQDTFKYYFPNKQEIANYNKYPCEGARTIDHTVAHF